MVIQESLTGAQLGFVLVYFIYGLAFFTMGIALSLESGRSPRLAERRSLWPLAIFGLVHGAHEWLEIFLIQEIWLGAPVPQWMAWLRIVLLAFSFLMLLVFSFSMLFPQAPLVKPILITCAFLMVFLGLAFVNARFNPDQGITRIDGLARLLLAVPGGVLAALALILHGSQMEKEGRLQLAPLFRWAGLGLGLYGLTQVFAPQSGMFPTNTLNSALFQQVTGIPIQVFRSVFAVFVTVNLLRSIQVADRERERQLWEAQRSRLDALEQIQRELEQREAMRRELLRHIVIAQEDERQRIARELHDESAQILAGFSLDLATLGSMLPRRAARSEHTGQPTHLSAVEILARLQKLARQLSQGLYRMVNDLRPAQLDDFGLSAALLQLGELEGARWGTKVTVETIGSRRRLDSLVETVIYRVAQEALANIRRHAGVDQAVVSLAFSSGEVRLKVCDQGVGFNPSQELVPPHGWGLAGMRERVESVGGELKIISAPGKGTHVEVVIPLDISIGSHAQEDIDAEEHKPGAG